MEGTVNQIERIEDSALRAEIQSLLQQPNVTMRRISKESGVSLTRLSQWVNDKYTGNIDAVCADLTRWIKSFQGRGAVTSNSTTWRPTPTGNRIARTLFYAQQAPDIALIYGGAGVGKTCTARHYRDENPNVWIATMTPAINSVPACLERIAGALNLSACPGGAAKAENAIVQRLDGTNGLLVVDEAQFLSPKCLEAIRSLYDASGAGIALMGNEIVYTLITGGSRQAQFAQLSSRIGFRLRLAEPAQGDVDAMLEAHGVQGGKTHKLCYEIAKRQGALRELDKVLRLARLMLEGDSAGISAEHIQAAWEELSGHM